MKRSLCPSQMRLLSSSTPNSSSASSFIPSTINPSSLVVDTATTIQQPKKKIKQKEEISEEDNKLNMKLIEENNILLYDGIKNYHKLRRCNNVYYRYCAGCQICYYRVMPMDVQEIVNTHDFNWSFNYSHKKCGFVEVDGRAAVLSDETIDGWFTVETDKVVAKQYVRAILNGILALVRGR